MLVHTIVQKELYAGQKVMKRSERGFSIVEAVIVLVVLGLLGAGGYAVLHRHDKADKQSVATPPAGSTAAIDKLMDDDATDEAALDSQYSGQDATDAQSADTAANNLGDAYNESNL